MTLPSLFADALRSLARRPPFAAFAVLTLGLGVAAATTLFSLIAGTLLTPSQMAEPERLMVLHRPGSVEGDLGYPDIADLAARRSSFAAVGAIWAGYALDVQVDGRPRRLVGALVDPGWWRAVDVEPLLGRIPEASTIASDGPTVVASERFWRSQLGADPASLGRPLMVNGRSHVLIGVVPDAADALRIGADLFAPVGLAGDWVPNERGANVFDVLARLAPGVGQAAAQADVDTLMAALAEAHPRTNQGKRLQLSPLDRFLHAGSAPLLWSLQLATLVLLAVAVVNLGALLLVRGSARGSEYQLRTALGADRATVIRMLLAEGSLLGLGGWLLGLALAHLAIGLSGSWFADALPGEVSTSLDLRVVGACLALSLGGAILASLLPAWAALRAVRPAAMQSAGSRGERRALGGLLVVEIALACVLMVGAALLLRSVHALSQVPLGFHAEGILNAQLVLPESRYGSRPPQTLAVERMLAALQAIPGVRRASFVTGGPLQPDCCIGSRLIAENVEQPANEELGVRVRPVLGDYFGALDIPLQQGRLLGVDDDEDAPRVALVNQALASKLFPQGDAVGRRIAWRTGSVSGDAEGPLWMEVVGVVGDIRASTLREDDVPAVYLPYPQRQREWVRFGSFLIEVEGEPAGYAAAMQDAIASVDPEVPLDQVAPLSLRVGEASASERFAARLASGFALLAWLLSLQGLAVVLWFVVARLRRELGIRAALGAGPALLQRLVLRRGLHIAALGLALGLPLALFAGGSLEHLLYGIPALDPGSLLLPALLIAASTVLACWLPARQASRIDPLVALRHE
ncbi:ADOP family duplicated permease [Pseudomarimonas salicorniae]|uniref:ADOP family duplicated permease n=1 Tax=Pseudomarimonas salicorniae TaxID=2933270 RepID=A0ABT0GGQ9_9GAMM|nr:ADOP family duplicated permease [Lysobacter sp. CAU 1642]MCK7593537.1 ADOP family duplicated permease [Lysobacter sp. CAU 1642]